MPWGYIPRDDCDLLFQLFFVVRRRRGPYRDADYAFPSPADASVSGIPVVLDGSTLRVLVVGGGAVATRRARALLDAGAVVRAVAPSMSPTLRAASGSPALTLVERAYTASDIGDATLVVAATGDRATNARVARDAQARGRLANVADMPGEGNCAFAAVHRVGPVVIGVTTGGVPAASMRIRDVVATRIDERYGRVLDALGALRGRLLAEQGRTAWRTTMDSLVGDDFCETVESGALQRRLETWR